MMMNIDAMIVLGKPIAYGITYSAPMIATPAIDAELETSMMILIAKANVGEYALEKIE
jgi:hypothetical protein